LKHSSTIPRMPAMMYEMIIHRSCDREKKEQDEQEEVRIDRESPPSASADHSHG
jgi:hypothetical protein